MNPPLTHTQQESVGVSLTGFQIPISPAKRMNSSSLEWAPTRNEKGNANITHYSAPHATFCKRPKESEYSHLNLQKKC